MLDVSKPNIMGILNVTPDSFTDGGLYSSVEQAVQHAIRMVDEGADIIDVGGESTRPGSQRVAPEQQLVRVLPVITQLSARISQSTKISIDTTSRVVAEEALKAGASIINDVSAGRDDPEMTITRSQKQVLNSMSVS